MPTDSRQKTFTCNEKIRAVALVYCFGHNVTTICRQVGISRTTFYRWEKQLKASIQPVWGGLGKKKPRSTS